MPRWRLLGPLLAFVLIAAGAVTLPVATAAPVSAAVAAPPTGPPVTVCSTGVAAGPATAPAGAVTVDPAVVGDVSSKTQAQPAGTTFWLAPGVHKLGGGQFDQVIPKNGNVYLGAPGAVLDGQGLNNFAFTQQAADVRIAHLEIRGFNAPQDQGVVNHDSGDRWVIEHNNIHHNKGAALMAGPEQVVRGNCLKDNGQYAMNAYDGDMNITDMLVEGNEITGNNTDDHEASNPGCGCSGGIKFWAVDGAEVRNNYVHRNHGAGLWADNNNNDFLFEGNYLEANEGIALFYEQGYNAIIRNNTFLNNGWEQGQEFASRNDNFPIGAIYLSEAGGDARIAARTTKIEILNNRFTNNWAGVVMWENADRFCNSPANTGTDCTLVMGIHNQSQCVQPGIASEPLYGNCRWKTKEVDVHHNTFAYDPAAVPQSREGFSGRQAVFSNWGTFPDWSPYKGDVIQQAITFDQNNRWHDNTYSGPWGFMAFDTGRSLTWDQWRAGPYNQDANSTNNGEPPPPPPAAACGDGVDNDADGKVDFPADPGCTDTADTDEADPPPPPPPAAACDDALDNDADGKVDFPADPGCTDAADTDETDPPPPPPAVTIESANFETNTENHVAWYGASVSRSTTSPIAGVSSLLASSTARYGSGVQLSNWPGYTGVEGGRAYDVSLRYVESRATMPTVTWNVEWVRADGSVSRTDQVSMPRSTTIKVASGRFTAPADAVRVRWTFTWSVTSTGPAFKIDDLLVRTAQ